MKRIIIVGAGHLGLDVYYLIKEINEIQPTWFIEGFINDIDVDLSKYKINSKIINTIQDYQPKEDEYFAMAIGSCDGREKIANLLKSKGAKFVTLVSPRAKVNETACIGEGCIITSTSKIGSCVKIGAFVVIGDSTISYGSEIGDYTNTASYDNVYKEIKIGHHVQIWSNSVILANIGNYATIGAGSIVIKRVKDNTKVFGNPAKRIDI